MNEVFFKDKDVLDLIKSETVFEILSLKEENSSNLLAWLLDPKESHGLKNKFAMHLLKACEENGKVYAYTAGKRNRNLDIEKKEYFENAVVWPEYTVEYLAGPNGKKEGRIDILLIDMDNNLAMVVENKYGSGELPNQCKKYKKALMDLCKKRPEMKFVFIFLDVRGTETSQEEFYDLSYDEVLNFKTELKEDTMAWRLLDSLERDVNGIEDDEKKLNDLCEKYGEELEKYVSKGLHRSNKKEILDDYFKTGNNEILRYAEYEDIIKKVLNFKKHQSKVFDVRYDEKFTKFIEDNKLEFSDHDYTHKGILTFSRDCFSNENDHGYWTVYGLIKKDEGNTYTFSIVYYSGKDKKMQERLKPWLNNKESKSHKLCTSSDVRELMKHADDFLTALNEAEKLFKN